MQLAGFWLGKLLELAGLLCMPIALWLGFTVDGSAGMGLELRWMVVGGGLFLMGRSLEAATGAKP